MRYLDGAVLLMGPGRELLEMVAWNHQSSRCAQGLAGRGGASVCTKDRGLSMQPHILSRHAHCCWLFLKLWLLHPPSHLPALSCCLPVRSKRKFACSCTAQPGAVTHSGDIMDIDQQKGANHAHIDFAGLGPRVQEVFVTLSGWAGAMLANIMQPYVQLKEPKTGELS